MEHWIGIEEGTYQLESAFVFTSGYTAVPLECGVMEVYLDSNAQRRLRGHGRAVNTKIVELLEDYDDLDILIDLGDSFHYILRTPRIMGGKMFLPEVQSLIHYIANGPAHRLSNAEYQQIHSRLTPVGG